MKTNFADTFFYWLARMMTAAMRFIPVRVSLFCARRIASAAFYLLPKKRRTAYKNIKIAFPHYSPKEISRIVKKTFMNMAQSCMETFYLRWLNKKYVNRFITIEGAACAEEAMRSKKGNIILGIHEGSWEIATALFGCMFSNQKLIVLTRTPRNFKKLYGLLDSYREKNGFLVVNTDEGLRHIVQYLKKGYTLFIAIDHGSEGGAEINFFGRKTLVATGALKLALRLDLNVFIGSIVRRQGPYHTASLKSYQLIKTGDDDEDLQRNLDDIHRGYEQFLMQHPDEYHWFYKKWKYSSQRTVLVLSDGKPGHLKQSLAVVDLMKQTRFEIIADVIELKFSGFLRKSFLHCCGLFSSRACQGCLWCLRHSAGSDALQNLNARAYDVVISCGSSLALANRLLAFENAAKSIVIMRPGIFSFKRFDLVIMPRHDRFPRAHNVVTIEGALTRNPDVYKNDIEAVRARYQLTDKTLAHPVIGFILGGESKTMEFDEQELHKLLQALKQTLTTLNASLLLTTSRRTSGAVEAMIKNEFKDNARCRMLTIANDDNPRGAFEAILSLSDMFVVSGDSISMISEALHYEKPIAVFKLKKKTRKISKHEIFVQQLESDGLAIPVSAGNLTGVLETLWQTKPQQHTIDDKQLILEKLKQLL